MLKEEERGGRQSEVEDGNRSWTAEKRVEVTQIPTRIVQSRNAQFRRILTWRLHQAELWGPPSGKT